MEQASASTSTIHARWYGQRSVVQSSRRRWWLIRSSACASQPPAPMCRSSCCSRAIPGPIPMPMIARQGLLLSASKRTLPSLHFPPKRCVTQGHAKISRSRKGGLRQPAIPFLIGEGARWSSHVLALHNKVRFVLREHMFDPGGIDGGAADRKDSVRLVQAVETGLILCAGRRLIGCDCGYGLTLEDERHAVAVQSAGVVQA